MQEENKDDEAIRRMKLYFREFLNEMSKIESKQRDIIIEYQSEYDKDKIKRIKEELSMLW